MPVTIKVKGNPSGAVMTPKEGVASNKAKTSPKTSLYAPIIDKITITLKVPSTDYGAISDAVDEAVENNPLFENTKKATGYKVVQLIAPEGAYEKVHFGFGKKKAYLPDVRFNFNPGKIGAKGMEGLHKVFSPIFPGGWGYIVQHGRVSNMDIAVDFPGIRMHHFHLLPHQVLTTKTYETEGKLKTITIGKPKGNQLKAYSKSYEIWAKVHKKKGPKGPPVVRIEQRLGKMKNNLKDLAQLENPLTKFKVVAYPPEPPANASKIGKAVWPFFKDSVGIHGLGPALKLLPPNEMTTFRKHFAAHAVPWWDPEAIWANWPEILKESKLLP